LVVEPGGLDVPDGSSGRASAAAALGARAIRGVGEGPGLVLRANSLGECIDLCGRHRVDLVVVDESLGADAEEVVARMRRSGPALIVLQRGTRDAAALAWFRRGAAECVTADRDFAALRHAVREQLERIRAVRDESTAQSANAPAAYGILRDLVTALIGVDAAGRIEFANPAAERILGTSQAELRGKAFEDLLHGDDGAHALESARAGGDAAGAVETRVRRPDGSVIPVALSWGPIGAAGGAARGAVAVLQDLSSAQAWRAHVLQTEKMASIGQLAAGVAHEINNPMGFIHANLFQMTEYVSDLRQVWTRVEGLLKALDAGDGELLERAAAELTRGAEELDVGFVLQDLGKAIRESQEGSERIRHIVQDLRDFSHQDTGERVLSDINQCLDSTANIVWPMMKHLVVLSKEYGELPSVPCYPMQLKQVFMNLLVNAYQAIEEAAANAPTPGWMGTVTLRTEPRDDGVCVAISDTGVGIPPEHLDRIFDPFFTTKKVGAGTGLGLSTSFNIVRRHGGTMRVESRLGVGTTFSLQLPLLSETLGEGSA
jgi:PAS domain S-box-containing protein